MKMIGMARLGRDAEIRYLPDDTAVANLSLAVNYYSKDAENNRATQWINATLWGKQAESLSQYMTKGSVHCFTLSDIHLEAWESQNGSGVNMVARVDSVELGPRQGEGGGQGASAPQQQRQASAPAQKQQKPAAKKPGNFDDFDDDIPF